MIVIKTISGENMEFDLTTFENANLDGLELHRASG